MSDAPEEHSFTLDLSAAELERRAVVYEALGDSWDPSAALADEERAYALLYSDLDAEQQAIHAQLVAAGVLLDRDAA